MPTIDLNDTEMGTLMFILANAEFKNGVSWAVMNPLITNIAQQARAQATPTASNFSRGTTYEGMRAPPPHVMHPVTDGEAKDE